VRTHVPQHDARECGRSMLVRDEPRATAPVGGAPLQPGKRRIGAHEDARRGAGALGRSSPARAWSGSSVAARRDWRAQHPPRPGGPAVAAGCTERRGGRRAAHGRRDRAPAAARTVTSRRSTPSRGGRSARRRRVRSRRAARRLSDSRFLDVRRHPCHRAGTGDLATGRRARHPAGGRDGNRVAAQGPFARAVSRVTTASRRRPETTRGWVRVRCVDLRAPSRSSPAASPRSGSVQTSVVCERRVRDAPRHGSLSVRSRTAAPRPVGRAHGPAALHLRGLGVPATRAVKEPARAVPRAPSEALGLPRGRLPAPRRARPGRAGRREYDEARGRPATQQGLREGCDAMAPPPRAGASRAASSQPASARRVSLACDGDARAQERQARTPWRQLVAPYSSSRARRREVGRWAKGSRARGSDGCSL
jgi:hypothetical protein